MGVVWLAACVLLLLRLFVAARKAEPEALLRVSLRMVRLMLLLTLRQVVLSGYT